MYNYIFRRLLQGIPVLLILSLLIYILINLAPGDPLSRIDDPSVSRGDIVRKYDRLGLNDPLLLRYVRWLRNFMKGDMGISLDSARRPVSEIIGERLLPTLYLTVGAMVISLLIAIPVGIVSATRQYSLFDQIATIFSFLGLSIPGFFFGLILLWLFSLVFPIFPSGGFSNPFGNNNFWTYLYHAFLPICALGFTRIASLMRYIRSGMLEVIKEDYIRTARAKGLERRIVTFKHGLRNAMIPVITLLGLQIPYLFSGAVIIEQVFSWPGLGKLLIRAVWQRNYTLLMALNIIFAILVFLGNLIADVLYLLVDPRIKYN